MELDALLGGVLAPVAIALAIVFAVRLIRARYAWCGSARVPAAALALAVVLACAHQSISVTVWPRIALEWWPWSVIAGAAVACAMGDGVPRAMGWKSASVAAALAVMLGLAFLSPPGIGAQTRIAWVVFCALVAAVAAPTLDAAGPSGAVGLWGSAAAVSMLALQASLAQIAVVLGAFSACAAALAVMAQFQRPLRLGAPGAALWVTVLGGASFLGMGYDESSLPPAVWWLAAASPAACALSRVPAIARRARLAAIVRACVPIAVAGAAAAIAAAAIAFAATTPSTR